MSNICPSVKFTVANTKSSVRIILGTVDPRVWPSNHRGDCGEAKTDLRWEYVHVYTACENPLRHLRRGENPLMKNPATLQARSRDAEKRDLHLVDPVWPLKCALYCMQAMSETAKWDDIYILYIASCLPNMTSNIYTHLKTSLACKFTVSFIQ